MNIDKENTGLIFEVESDNENAPAFRGVINVDGVQKEISLWHKEFKGGKEGFSAQIKEPFVKSERKARGEKPAGKLTPKAKPKSAYRASADDEDDTY